MKIDEQRVLLTGGASGIGRAMAQRLAARGAIVYAADRDATAISACQAEDGASLHYVHCDVGNEDQVRHMVQRVEAECGGITIVVNNAAVLRDQALVARLGRNIRKHSLADWEETLRSNLTGTFLVARESAEVMIRARRPGLIVNVSSISRHGNPGQTAYSASKAAVDALTVTWAQELAPYRIRVVALAPGFVETSMTRAIPPIFLSRLRERTPLNRFGTLDEFAHAVEFIVENDYLNGKVLELDGGLRF